MVRQVLERRLGGARFFLRSALLGVALLGVIQTSMAGDDFVAVGTAETDGWQVQESLVRRKGEPARLAAVYLDEGHGCIASVPAVRVDGKVIPCSAPRRVWSWFVMAAIPRDYDNSTRCLPPEPGCVQPIAYRTREMVELRGRGEVAASEVDALLGLGSHWVRAALKDGGPSTRLVEAQGRPTNFGFVVRRDDSYTGYLTELLGVPFAYLPALTPGGRHQTDLRLGADCIALVVYGQRRLGRSVPYMAPPALTRFTTVVASDAAGQQPIERGDVLHFGFQTAVVSVDRGRIGLLDGEDLIIHTYHGLAEEVAFVSLPYRHGPFEVRRWNSFP